MLTPDITPEDDHPTGWTGGFDVVVGNPPWEKLKLVEREYFAARFPAIAGAPTASARRGAIGTLRGDDPDAAAALERARRRAAGVAALVRATRAFPLCSRGDLNAYALFAERTRQLLAPGGRAGIVVPTGIATDETTQGFFRAVVDAGELRSLWDFENRRTFAAVHASFKFCVLALERGGARAPARFAFFLRAPRELEDPARAFELRAADLAAINPNTRTCPVFRSRRDADLVRRIHARVPVLRPAHGAGPWGASFATQFHMSADSGRFRGRAELERAGCALDGNALAKPGARYVPLYEAKMVHHFDHRFGDYRDRAVPSANVRLGAVPEARSADRTYRVLPRYWVAAHDHAPRPLADAPWLLGFRDICRSTDERTLIAAVLPPAAVGNPLPLVATAPRPERVVLAAMLSSFALDFVARTKVGGTHLNFFVAAQLPVLPPEVLAAPCAWSPSQTVLAWLRERVVELTYTADDVRAFALECGYTGAPFGWDRERRFQLRAELDAAFFWLYGLTREEVAFVMETFPIVQSRDIARHGSYRTRDAILAVHARLGAPPACR